MSRQPSTNRAGGLRVSPMAASGAVDRARVVSLGRAGLVERDDWVVVEEPLEIRAGGPGQEPVSVAVTMRTPGHDFELAVGFLRTEGLIESRDQIAAPGGSGSSLSLLEDRTCNVVLIETKGVFDGSRLNRNFLATSSCGLCGKSTLDQVEARCDPVAPGPLVSGSVIVGLPESLRASQTAFERTGGLHAAGLFDAEGRLLTIREDVGRHNAVDKLIGRAFLDALLPLSGHILLVSGRTSFEILQKAAIAGVPIVAAVSAPSSLAIATADRLGVTLIGFLRGPSFNVYTHPGRIGED